MSKHVPPSRKRYEARNPNLSFRVPLELKQRLDALRAETGVSGADILKQALGENRPLLKKARDAGYQEGFKAARDRYAVVIRCAGCKKPMRIEGEDVYRSAAASLEAEGWGHAGCVRG